MVKRKSSTQDEREEETRESVLSEQENRQTTPEIIGDDICSANSAP